MPEDVQYGRNT